MDTKTLQFYAEHATELAAKYDAATGGIERYFTTAFPPGSRILDIGCGSGRDLRYLHRMGYRADGVDATAELVSHARRNRDNGSGTVVRDCLPGLITVADNSYDGVLCAAVLMHLPVEQLEKAVLSIRRVLKSRGRLLLSVPHPDDKTIDKRTGRDAGGRFFNQITPEELRLWFEGGGFQFLRRWDDADALKRPHRRWVTMLFESAGNCD